MHKNVINKKYSTMLFASLSVAVMAMATSQSIQRAEASPSASYAANHGEISGAESREIGVMKVSDDDRRYSERGRSDYHDARSDHESREHYQPEHEHSREINDRTRQDNSHHEHEEHEHHNQYGH
jgi:hypothetical protein